MAAECPDRRECLHLVASDGHSLDSLSAAWNRLDGSFRRFPIGVRKVGQIAKSGQALEALDLLKSPPGWIAEPAWIQSEMIVAFAGEPLIFKGRVLGVLAVFARPEIGDSCLQWLRMIASHLAAAIANAQALAEIGALRRRLEQENEYLREEVEQGELLGELVGNSPALQSVGRQIDLVAKTDASVLILGESGTGKELVARELHRRSHRADRPLIKVNCAAIPRELYESEFFGHSRGSLTGALRDRAGRFELAHGGITCGIHMQSEPSLRSALVYTAAFGLIFWLIPCGSFHAYVACVDWEAIGKQQIPQVVTLRNIVFLCVVGLSIGLAAQTLAVLGGVIRSEALILFGPITVGVLFGTIQGIVVATDVWGNTTFGIPLRSLTTRLLTGAFCGFVAVPALMAASAILRRVRSATSRSYVPAVEPDEDQKQIEEMLRWARKRESKWWHFWFNDK